jgi:hypothetical protein
MPYTLTKPGSPVQQTVRTYEATRDALLAITNSFGGSAVSSYTYQVNEIGQRETMTMTTPLYTGRTTEWGYNARGELVSAVRDTDTFAYRADQ